MAWLTSRIVSPAPTSGRGCCASCGVLGPGRGVLGAAGRDTTDRPWQQHHSRRNRGEQQRRRRTAAPHRSMLRMRLVLPVCSTHARAGNGTAELASLRCRLADLSMELGSRRRDRRRGGRRRWRRGLDRLHDRRHHDALEQVDRLADTELVAAFDSSDNSPPLLAASRGSESGRSASAERRIAHDRIVPASSPGRVAR